MAKQKNEKLQAILKKKGLLWHKNLIFFFFVLLASAEVW